MTASNSIIEHADQLQALTREYARFSRSAGGLSAVAGGVLCLAAYLAGGLLATTPALQGLLIATPLAWLILKQWMASRYYQRFGQVEVLVPASERRMRWTFAGFTALVSVAVVVGTLENGPPSGLAAWDARSIAYLLAVLILPLIVWRWLRNPLDFAVGAFLMCQAALALVGQAYPLWSSAAVFPFVAVILIVVGIRDHRTFLGIEAKIHEIMQSRRSQA